MAAFSTGPSPSPIRAKVQPDDSHLRPAGAYVHVPFCRRRCGYCNFTLIADREDLIESYLECLETELSQVLKTPQPVKSLFIGGGTPTFLPPSRLASLVELLQRWLPVEEPGEYSCEANPLDCDADRLRILKAAGVNRLSLGGQSFNDQKLAQLERDHSGRQLRQALDDASGFFENLSLDLIFSVPGETVAVWQQDLETALKSPIRHLSTYGLTVEKGTTFFNRMLRGDLAELEAELQLEMYLNAIEKIQAAGWHQYEVSNFAQSGFQCRHNIGYWNGQCWWALGPGAASCLPESCVSRDGQLLGSQEPRGQRWILANNHRSTTQYIKRIRNGKSPIAESQWLDLEHWIRQRLVFGLRQIEGVDLSELSALWGDSVESLFEPYLSRYIDQGWLQCNGGRLQLTRQGLVISDSLWPDLLA